MSNNWNDQAKKVREGEELNIAALEPYLQQELGMPVLRSLLSNFLAAFPTLPI